MIGLGNCLFSNKNYRIYRAGTDYIVHNKNKPFKDGHTHCANFELCRAMIYTCLEGRFPKKFHHMQYNEKFVESLTRICSNKYKRQFSDMLFEIRERKEIHEVEDKNLDITS